jgi:hypothetical protein
VRGFVGCVLALAMGEKGIRGRVLTRAMLQFLTIRHVFDRSRADHSKRPFDTQSPKACSVGCVMCQHMHEEGKVHVGRGGALSGGYPGIKVISARDLGIPWTEAIIVHLSTDGTGLDRAASAS